MAGEANSQEALRSDQWFEEADTIEIVDYVYGSYQSMCESISDYALGSNFDETSLLLSMGPDVPPPHRAQAANQALRKLKEEGRLGVYPYVSSRAYKRFFEDGIETSDFSQCLALIGTLNDPEIARVLLDALNKPLEPGGTNDEAFKQTEYYQASINAPDRAYFAALQAMVDFANKPAEELRIAFHKYIERIFLFAWRTEARKEVLSDDTTILDARAIRGQLLHPKRLAGPITEVESSLKDQLADICSLPPLAVQVLIATAGGQVLPLEKYRSKWRVRTSPIEVLADSSRPYTGGSRNLQLARELSEIARKRREGSASS